MILEDSLVYSPLIPFWAECLYMILVAYGITRIVHTLQDKIPAAPFILVICMGLYIFGIGNLLLVILTASLSDVIYFAWHECIYRIKAKLNKNKNMENLAC